MPTIHYYPLQKYDCMSVYCKNRVITEIANKSLRNQISVINNKLECAMSTAISLYIYNISMSDKHQQQLSIIVFFRRVQNFR